MNDMHNWIPISEAQPKVGQDAIYIKQGAKYARIGGYMGNGKWCNELGIISDFPPVTHWMPLPKPPVREAES